MYVCVCRGGVSLRPGDGIIHSWLNRMLLPDTLGTGNLTAHIHVHTYMYIHMIMRPSRCWQVETHTLASPSACPSLQDPGQFTHTYMHTYIHKYLLKYRIPFLSFLITSIHTCMHFLRVFLFLSHSAWWLSRRPPASCPWTCRSPFLSDSKAPFSRASPCAT